MTTDAELLANEPRTLFPSARSMFSVDRPSLEALQLRALQMRFDSLASRLPLLRRKADRSTIATIRTLEDGAHLLYPSNVYKSYQLPWLLNAQFAPLTAWLQQLTTHDLSSVEANDATSLDSWFTALESASPLRVCHSSATTGKLSFVPRSESEWVRRATTMSYANEAAGKEEGPDVVSLAGIPILSPFYRSGHSAFLMSLDWNIRVHGNEDDVVTAYPGSLSSDLLVLAGQLRSTYGADAISNLNPSILSNDELRARWEELRNLVAGAPEDAVAEFVTESHRRFEGQRIWLIGVWPSLVDAALQADRVGISKVFDPSTIVHTGGGSKGRDLPEGWRESVVRWLGVHEILDTYGMSEVMGMNACCGEDHYHLNAWTIPYLFDASGKTPLPRTGRQTGRFGAIDLLADSYWGGFLSSDEVTITWDEPCACGRIGAYLDTTINRVLDEADEKVSCAATPSLHDELVSSLSRLGA